jgi:2-keto-3-deoxy-L-rhamnonate aldolase RhmA
LTAHQSFRSRLAAGELQIGSFIKTPTGHATEIFGSVGFNFVVVDSEHAPFDRTVIDQVILSAHAAAVPCIIRVSSASGPEMLSALDCGATGVLVPHITSATMAREVVAKCRFRGGHRGFSNSTRAGNYGAVGMWDYVESCDALTTVIGMIEDPEAVEVIDEIVAVEGLDAIFIGRGDLMIAYEAQSPMAEELTRATEKIIAAAKAAGKPVITVTPGGKDAEMLKGLGVSGFLLASDQGFLRQAAAAALKDIRADAVTSV